MDATSAAPNPLILLAALACPIVVVLVALLVNLVEKGKDSSDG